MVHSVGGCMQGVQVKLWDPLRTRAIPEHLGGVIVTRCFTNQRLPYLTLSLPVQHGPHPCLCCNLHLPSVVSEARHARVFLQIHFSGDPPESPTFSVACGFHSSACLKWNYIDLGRVLPTPVKSPVYWTLVISNCQLNQTRVSPTKVNFCPAPFSWLRG